jgi:hypothetical protein
MEIVEYLPGYGGECFQIASLAKVVSCPERERLLPIRGPNR